MNHLQKSLSANAIFSCFSGLLLVVQYENISGLFGIEKAIPFWIIGTGLLLFALFVFITIKQQKLSAVQLIVFMDILWVMGSITVLIIHPFNLTLFGHVTIGIVALIVLILATAQTKALSHIDNASQKGWKQLVFARIVNAPQSKTWEVISDVENYHNIAPNIDKVKIISGQGKGMIRSCHDGKNSWSETCTNWQEWEQYSFEVNTKAPGYPFPFDFLKGTWKVEALAPDQTRIVMIFDLKYKRKIFNTLLHPLLKEKFEKIGEELLNNWQNFLEKTTSSAYSKNNG